MLLLVVHSHATCTRDLQADALLVKQGRAVQSLGVPVTELQVSHSLSSTQRPLNGKR